MDLQHARERLRKSEANLKKAEKIAKLGNWEWNILTNEITWSDEIYRIYGIDPVTDKPSFEVVIQAVAPEYRDRFVSAVENAVKHNVPFEGEYRMIGLDGTERFTHTIGEVVRDPGGRPLSMFGVVQDITRRRKVEDSLRKAERLYQELVETAQDLIWQCDTEGRYTYVNGAWETVLGYGVEEILGRKFSEFQDAETARRDTELFGQLLQGGMVKGYETVHRSKSGGEVHLVFNAIFVRDEQGVILGTRGTAHDITERKQVEEKLRTSEARLKESQQVAKIGSWSWDIVNSRLDWSNEAFQRFDKDPETFTPTVEYFVGLVHPEDRETIRIAIQDSLENDAPYHIQPRIKNESGREWVLEGFGVVERDAAGKPIRFAGTVQDITERKLAEDAVRESEERFRALTESTSDWIWEVDATARYTYGGPKVRDILGYEPSEILGKTPFDLMPPDEARRVLAEFGARAEARLPIAGLENINLHKKGHPVVLETSAVPIIDQYGQYRGYRGIDRDITNRKRTEEKVRESEKFIRSILDTVDEGFIVIDRDYRILTANQAYCGQAGLPCDEVIGRHCYAISHKASRPCYEEGEECAVRQVFADGEPHAALHKHIDHEGNVLYVETKAYPIRDASGAVTSVIETISNITEKHLLEEERLKTQKLESIGMLAGGIAHDFNNLLQGVFGFISLARLKCDDKEQGLAALAEAEKALHMSVKLTNQLLTFSKGGKPVKHVIDLGPVIESAAKFALSGSRSDFRLDIDPGLWNVDADEGQVGQVIQNIVLNADQAMPLGGRVAISARNLAAAETASHPGLERGDHIVITVEDRGAGIPEEYLDKIFDPYFTTKAKGSGLGLATSYSIIRNHGGRLEVRSAVGKGTSFRIYLPAVRTEAALQEKPQQLAMARKSRVLVMDDEAIIRRVAQDMLGSLGHEAAVAEHGDAAIRQYRQAMSEGRPFDVVILDLTIRGGMGGLETLRKLREIDPGVKAVVSSGYSGDDETADYRTHGFRSYLKKPYNLEHLQDVLNRLTA